MSKKRDKVVAQIIEARNNAMKAGRFRTAKKLETVIVIAEQELTDILEGKQKIGDK